MDSQTVAWIVVNLIGSVCVNLGQNVMKMGHNKRAALECLDSERPNIKRIREWQVGVVIFLAGGIANFVSFGYAPQSLLSALGSVQFVSNVVFASVVLKERVTVRTIGATACIVAGCVLLVVFTGSSSETLTVPVLMSYYSSPAYIAYLVAMLFVATGFFSLYRHGKRLSARGEARQHWDRLLPVSYALFCAPLGTQSVLFSKSVSVLLRTTLAGESQLGYWFTYVSLIAFVVTITFWVTRLNKSLKLFTAIVIVPTMQIGWTIFSILSGGIYFHEFEDYDSLETAMFVLGVVVIMAGVFFLTPAPPRSPEKYEEMLDESVRGKGAVEGAALSQPLSPRDRSSVSTDEDAGALPPLPLERRMTDAALRMTEAAGRLARSSLDSARDAVESKSPSDPAMGRIPESREARGAGAAEAPNSFAAQMEAVRAALREDFGLDFSVFGMLGGFGPQHDLEEPPVLGLPVLSSVGLQRSSLHSSDPAPLAPKPAALQLRAHSAAVDGLRADVELGAVGQGQGRAANTDQPARGGTPATPTSKKTEPAGHLPAIRVSLDSGHTTDSHVSSPIRSSQDGRSPEDAEGFPIQVQGHWVSAAAARPHGPSAKPPTPPGSAARGQALPGTPPEGRGAGALRPDSAGSPAVVGTPTPPRPPRLQAADPGGEEPAHDSLWGVHGGDSEPEVTADELSLELYSPGEDPTVPLTGDGSSLWSRESSTSPAHPEGWRLGGLSGRFRRRSVNSSDPMAEPFRRARSGLRRVTDTGNDNSSSSEIEHE